MLSGGKTGQQNTDPNAHPGGQSIMRWLVTSIHVLVVACAVSIPVAVFNGTLFSWHPALMSIAYLGLMAEGVLTSISFRSLVGCHLVEHERCPQLCMSASMTFWS